MCVVGVKPSLAPLTRAPSRPSLVRYNERPAIRYGHGPRMRRCIMIMVRRLRVTDLQQTAGPAATAAMLIRKPVDVVFEAFVNPEITTRFWFTHGSGRLAPDARVRWEWAMYNASAEVTVTAFEPDRRLAIGWPGEGGPTSVEWTFTPRADGTTFVSITNAGFHGDPAAVQQQLVDATEGFTLVLAGLKAYLEHGIALNLVADRFPPD